MSVPPENDAPEWVRSWLLSLMQNQPCSLTPVRSNEINAVFLAGFGHGVLFLKIGPDLHREYERLCWLENRLSCPKPLGFTTHDGTDALLMSAIEGDDLAVLSASVPPLTVVTRLVQALHGIHAVSITDWPFGGEGTTLVHGDACLPNFVYRGDCLSGYIDVGAMTVGEPEVDLAAAIWSLQYNLGAGHGLRFLYEYGRTDAQAEDVERLRLQYEEG